jgi:hypothetical protein
MSDSGRSRRRIVLDPRLLLGAALVVASVVGVTALVGAADTRVTVYAAVDPLVPGQRVDADDLAERSVALDGTENLYLTSADLPLEGLVLTRTVAAGELIPRSAAGDAHGVRATAVVIELAAPASSSVTPGSTVDVWSTAARGQDEYAPPTVLAAGATVVRIAEQGGFVAGAGSELTVEVLVPRTRVARLLQAIADDDVLTVVPAGLPLRRP